MGLITVAACKLLTSVPLKVSHFSSWQFRFWEHREKSEGKRNPLLHRWLYRGYEAMSFILKRKERRQEVAHVIQKEELKNFLLDELLIKRIVDNGDESFNWTLIHNMQFRKRFTSMQKFWRLGVQIGWVRQSGKNLDDNNKYKLQPFYDSQIKIKKKKYEDLMGSLTWFHQFTMSSTNL